MSGNTILYGLPRSVHALTYASFLCKLTRLVKDTERWSSWLKAPVLKTGEDASPPRVRIPLSPPFKDYKRVGLVVLFYLE
jgi:hypothetical protein